MYDRGTLQPGAMRGVAFAVVVLVLAGTAVVAGAQPPLADAGLDQRVDQGDLVIVDGMGSSDPDGSIDAYEWRIETPAGGQISPACPNCAWTRFRATHVGTYTVTLTVTDDDGLRRSDRLYVTVRPVAGVPAGTSGGPGFGPFGTAPGRSTDPATGDAAPGTADPTVPADVGPNDAIRSTWLGRPDQSSSPVGDLEITTYPTISPFGNDVGGVTYYSRPNGETESTTSAMVEVLVRTR